MSNVIRPNFGGRGPQPEAPQPAAAGDEYHPLHVYGTAAGHIVALLEDTRGQEGPAFKVVVGPAAGNMVETVAVMLATDAGRIDADAAAMAVLRALQIVEASDPASA